MGRRRRAAASRVTMASRRDVIRAVTTPVTPPGCEPLVLRLAPEPLVVWEAAEAHDGAQLGAPFWAHAWTGGVAVSRYVLELAKESPPPTPAWAPATPHVRGRRVLDFASGCGLAALAAVRAGARQVTAAEIDPWAAEAIALNAEENGLAVDVVLRDVIGSDDGWDVVLVGDAFYRDELSRRLRGWLAGLTSRGAVVLIGDPGRTFLPEASLAELARYELPPAAAWDSVVDRPARVWRFSPPRPC